MSLTTMKKILIEIIFSTLMERPSEKKIASEIVIAFSEFSKETEMGVQIKRGDLRYNVVWQGRLYYTTSGRLCCNRRS